MTPRPSLADVLALRLREHWEEQRDVPMSRDFFEPFENGLHGWHYGYSYWNGVPVDHSGLVYIYDVFSVLTEISAQRDLAD